MSLKFFHIFFLVASAILGVWVGLWCRAQQISPVWSSASYLASTLLLVYLLWFLKKSKGLH